MKYMNEIYITSTKYKGKFSGIYDTPFPLNDIADYRYINCIFIVFIINIYIIVIVRIVIVFWICFI